jgi:hypothetical protein
VRRTVAALAATAAPAESAGSPATPFEIPKASPESVARAIFDGLENGEEDIFPDPMSAPLAESWRGGAVKAMEREYAAFVAAQPVAA